MTVNKTENESDVVLKTRESLDTETVCVKEKWRFLFEYILKEKLFIKYFYYLT
jgi:hypothetical protein